MAWQWQDCLNGCLGTISRDLVCGAVNQLRYLCCFDNFVEELSEEETKLIQTRDSVENRIANANKQTRIIAPFVEKWAKDADIEVDNVEKLLEQARTKQSWCFGHCPNWIWRWNFGRKLAIKKTELEMVNKDGGQYIQLESVAPLPPSIPGFISEKYLSFASRQNAYKELMEAVKDDEVCMIGLYGMGGCGKTTMAKEVLKVAEADHQTVLFVQVSSTVEYRAIQDKIASSLQYKFEENGETERAKRLCMRLTQEDKILVILDDVWQILNFHDIGIPSPEHHKGCKVLITTRSEDVCSSMGCRKTIHLPILEDGEAWTLFQKEANINEGTSDVIKDLARQISDECKGLPVAIAAVGNTLKGKYEETWKVVLTRLRSSKPVNIERGLQDPYKCLELSYHFLDNEEAKSLFLLCSVFPEDYQIPIELLARCAIGLGIVGEVRSYEDARNEVIAAKTKLMSCCLLLDAPDDEYECVKMHDLVRDVAHLIAKNENKGIKCEVENDVTLEQNSGRYLWCKKLPNDLDYSNLEFLCVTTEVKVLDEIFTRMGKLRVLFLEHKSWRKLPLSTMSFNSLTNLRCLILLRWKLNDISFIRYMKKLESLSLKGCSLPSFIDLQKDDAVSHLTKLKLLVIHECEMEENIFEVIGRIPQLEELHIVGCTTEFHKTFSVPQTLQRYTIRYSRLNDERTLILFDSRLNDDGRWGFFSPNERTLILPCFDISNEATKRLAKEVKYLRINKSEEIECLVDSSNHTSECPKLTSLFTQAITPNPVRYTIFQNLQEVDIIGRGELKYVFSANTVGGLPQLKRLYIRNCNQLEQIVEGIIPSVANQLEIIEENTSTPSAPLVNHSPGSFTLSNIVSPRTYFPKLKRVHVGQCHKLKRLFSTSASNDIPYLEELIITSAPELEEIIGFEQGAFNNFQFQHLKTLEITGCAKLEVIFPVSVVRCLPELERLKIEECKELKHMMEEDESDRIQRELKPCFPKLKQVQVRICHKLKRLFSTSASNDLPYLEKLIINNAPELEEIIGFEQGAFNNFQFQHLKTLEIIGCAKLEVIFPVSVVRCLPELECLMITECKELKHIMEEDESDRIQRELKPCFPKLKQVYVTNCHKLKRLFSTSASNDLPYLEELSICGALELEELIGFEQGAFNNFQFQYLKSLKIERCRELKYVFSANTIGGLPQLNRLDIWDCDQLEQIVEGIIPSVANQLEIIEENTSTPSARLVNHSPGSFTLSNIVSPRPYFPKLKQVEVRRCHKLKRLFSTSASNDLPYLEELECLVIRECKKLKHIMEEDESHRIQRELKPCFPKLTVVIVDQCHKLKHLFSMYGADEQRKGEEIGKAKVELPKLKLLILIHLSNLCHGIELRAPKHCIINNCPKLSLTSTTTLHELYKNIYDIYDSEFANLVDPQWKLLEWIREIEESNEVSKSGSTSEFPSTQINEELEKEFIGEVHGSEVLATATSANSELNGRPSLSPLDVCQHETHSQMSLK